MKFKFLTVGLICTVIASMSLSSCIGSFALTNKLLAWNNTIDNKFVNEFVFFVLWCVPAYEVAALADVLVLNSIEFWSGTSPLEASSKIIEGSDAKYLVESDATGYTITSLTDKSQVRLNFDEPSQTWSIDMPDGEDYPLVSFVDDKYIKVNVGGEMMLMEKSQQGLYAMQQAASMHSLASK